MLEHADIDLPKFNPPATVGVYARYMEMCRRLGIEPVPHERAQGLIADALAVDRSIPPNTR